MSSIAIELAELLGTIRRPGDFFAAGITEFLAPRLEVEGVGPLALPLLPMQAEQLVAVAERAPHGRGTDTIVDTTVRRTWQIAADRVRIGGQALGADAAGGCCPRRRRPRGGRTDRRRTLQASSL
jgi:hypothetical protein